MTVALPRIWRQSEVKVKSIRKEEAETDLRRASFRMADIGRKRPTRRYAVASGFICLGKKGFAVLSAGELPKGDPLALAEMAGIMAAKNTPQIVPMCHTVPLDRVEILCELDPDRFGVAVYAQVWAFAKTGVEMEALNAVQAALLTLWDLVKGIDPALSIGDVRLLAKTGGKSGVWVHPDGAPSWVLERLPPVDFLAGHKAAVLVMSDRASQGKYRDESGLLLKDRLENAGATVTAYKVVPDKAEEIRKAVQDCCNSEGLDLLVASGGTGPGPRDITPEVLEDLCDCMLDGFGDMLRAESLHYTDTAWLSRMTAGMIGSTLVLAFPGSPKAVSECWDIITPFLGDALKKIRKQGFEEAA